MKKLSKKGVLLLAAVLALCAMPSMASASSWGVVPSHHTLDSPDIGFIIDGAIGGPISSQCARTRLTMNVVSAVVAEISSVSFAGCQTAGAFTGTCTMTSTATNLPWTATAVSTSNIQIHGVNIDAFLEDNPGSDTCNGGLTFKVTGTVSGGRWSGNGANQHEMLLAPGVGGATGLQWHSAVGNGVPLTLTGTLRDTQQTLTVSG